MEIESFQFEDELLAAFSDWAADDVEAAEFREAAAEALAARWRGDDLS